MSAASRPLRRQMRALTWVTLEDVALDAVAEDGQLVARTSARQVAERLRIDPAAAAGALRVLRDRGLVRLEPDQRPGLARRFGLWVYMLGPIPGLTRSTPAARRLHSPLCPGRSRRASGSDRSRREHGAVGASRRVASVCAGWDFGCWGVRGEGWFVGGVAGVWFGRLMVVVVDAVWVGGGGQC